MTQVKEIQANTLDLLNYKLEKWQELEDVDIDILSVQQISPGVYLVAYDIYKYVYDED